MYWDHLKSNRREERCVRRLLWWNSFLRFCAPEVGILVGLKWSAFLIKFTAFVMRLMAAQRRNKKEVPRRWAWIPHKAKRGVYASWIQETKFKGLMPQQEQSLSQIAGVWPARLPSIPLTRDLFVVESQTLEKCSPGLREGCLSAYQANSVKGPYDAENRLLTVGNVFHDHSNQNSTLKWGDICVCLNYKKITKKSICLFKNVNGDLG